MWVGNVQGRLVISDSRDTISEEITNSQSNEEITAGYERPEWRKTEMVRPLTYIDDTNGIEKIWTKDAK